MGTVATARKSLSKIPDGLAYYPHQITGIRELARRNSFLLADEMGLGKTVQALTVCAIDFERGWAKRVLVVAPASIKWNWLDEIQKFTHFSAHVLDGSPAQRVSQLDDFEVKGTEFLIVNYEQVIAHLDMLNSLEFDIVVFDEAHYLKGYKSQRTKACQKIRAGRRFLLTGSPLLNQVNELWSLLHIISPRDYPSYWKFVHRYAVFGGFKDKQIVGVKNNGELTERIQDVMLRRLKKDVLDLPEKQYIQIRVELHPDQQKMYKQAVDEMKIDVAGAGPMEIENALTKFLRLKQICGTTAAIDPLTDHSFKLDRAEELIEEIVTPADDKPGEPVVVFTQFRSVQACMLARLAKLGIPTFEMNGDTPMKLRQEILGQWSATKADKVPAALVIMLQVGGVGLNMTAASKCIFLDKLFVPKLNEQAADRLHRIGADKTKPVQIYELICRNTIENRIETILRRKTKLFNELVEEPTASWKRALVAAVLEDD